MTDYKTLDGTVDSLAPYRKSADEGLIEIEGKKCALTIEQNKRLTRLDKETKSLEKRISRLSNSKYKFGYFDPTLDIFGIGGAAFSVLTGTQCIVTGLLTLAFVSGGWLYWTLDEYLCLKYELKEKLKNKQQQKQTHLEKLVK